MKNEEIFLSRMEKAIIKGFFSEVKGKEGSHAF
jgi:hypothetical protein